MLVVFQISCILVILVMYKTSPALLVEWYSRTIRCFVTNTPYTDKEKLFPEGKILEKNYKRIRAEIKSTLQSVELPMRHVLNQDTTQEAKNKALGTPHAKLKEFHDWAHSNDSLLPYLEALLCELPQVMHAKIRVCRGGEHNPQRVRLFKGVLSYHLPLLPRTNGRNYIVCGNIHCNYEEGVGVLVDETFQHEFWNSSDEPQVFLSLDISRDNALPRLVRPFNRILIKLIRRSRRMREAMRVTEMKKVNHSAKNHQLKIKQS